MNADGALVNAALNVGPAVAQESGVIKCCRSCCCRRCAARVESRVKSNSRCYHFSGVADIEDKVLNVYGERQCRRAVLLPVNRASHQVILNPDGASARSVKHTPLSIYC